MKIELKGVLVAVDADMKYIATIERASSQYPWRLPFSERKLWEVPIDGSDMAREIAQALGRPVKVTIEIDEKAEEQR